MGKNLVNFNTKKCTKRKICKKKKQSCYGEKILASDYKTLALANVNIQDLMATLKKLLASLEIITNLGNRGERVDLTGTCFGLLIPPLVLSASISCFARLRLKKKDIFRRFHEYFH